MLTIYVPGGEDFDEKTQEFITAKPTKLVLEHSLISISKWEAKWHKPFLSNKNNTYEELLDYIKCMTITQNVDPNVYSHLSDENITQINDYIEDPMTATTFGGDNIRKQENRGRRGRIVTSELIYYWMISLQIPIEFEKWHINRLMTLIRVCNEENKAQDPNNKMSKAQLMARNRSLNAARRKKYHTKG